jgi:hypothetical protein
VRCENGCGYGGLTEAQPAIARADIAVLKNLKTFFF